MYNHNLFFNEKYEIRGKKFDDQINEWSTKYKSLMSIEQKRFLMSIISENKIKNVLEVGIFNGVSSLCILKSGLSANKDFHLYSIDLNNNILRNAHILCAAKEHSLTSEECNKYFNAPQKVLLSIASSKLPKI